MRYHSERERIRPHQTGRLYMRTIDMLRRRAIGFEFELRDGGIITISQPHPLQDENHLIELTVDDAKHLVELLQEAITVEQERAESEQ